MFTGVLAEQPEGSAREWRESTRHLLALHVLGYAFSSSHEALLTTHVNLDREATSWGCRPQFLLCTSLLQSLPTLNAYTLIKIYGVQRHTVLGSQETMPY